METNRQNEQELDMHTAGAPGNEATPNDTSEQAAPADPQPRKKHRSSALYAASRWHATVSHVRMPNSGHTLLPPQM